jgi:Predicted transcriptional regulators
MDELEKVKNCPISYRLAMTDALNALSGKWKMPIIAALSFGKKRYSEIEKDVPKITPRMLSKELKELEANGIVSRIVQTCAPIAVEYDLTPSGRELVKVTDTMIEWGLKHRELTLNCNQ